MDSVFQDNVSACKESRLDRLAVNRHSDFVKAVVPGMVGERLPPSVFADKYWYISQMSILRHAILKMPGLDMSPFCVGFESL